MADGSEIRSRLTAAFARRSSGERPPVRADKRVDRVAPTNDHVRPRFTFEPLTVIRHLPRGALSAVFVIRLHGRGAYAMTRPRIHVRRRTAREIDDSTDTCIHGECVCVTFMFF